jgi:hypothetical protein
MNAPATVHPIHPGAAWLTPAILQSARDLATWHADQGRSGSAVCIQNLVAEIESLREAAKGSLVIVNQATSAKTLAELKLSTLFIVAEKLAPVIDDEIETRKQACVPEYVAPLQSLSDELHAALRLVRG